MKMMKKLPLLLFIVSIMAISTPVWAGNSPPVGGSGEAITLFTDVDASLLVFQAASAMEDIMHQGWFKTLLMLFAFLGFITVIISMWLSARFNITSLIAYLIFVPFILVSFTYYGGSKRLRFRRYYLNDPNVGTVKVPIGLWLIAGVASESMAAITGHVDSTMSIFTDGFYKAVGNDVNAVYSVFMSRVPMPGGYKTAFDDFFNQCVMEPFSSGSIKQSADGIKLSEVDSIQLLYYFRPSVNTGAVRVTIDTSTGNSFTCGDYYNLIVGRSDSSLLKWYMDHGYIKIDYSGASGSGVTDIYTYRFCPDPSNDDLCRPIGMLSTSVGTINKQTPIQFMLQAAFDKTLRDRLSDSKAENAIAKGTSNAGWLSKLAHSVGEWVARYMMYWVARSVIRAAPIIQGIVIALLFLVYPIIILFVFIPNFGGLKYLWGYFTTFFWVLSWGLFYVLLSHFAMTRVNSDILLSQFQQLAQHYLLMPSSFVEQIRSSVNSWTIAQAIAVVSAPALTYPIFIRGGAGMFSAVMAGSIASREAATVVRGAASASIGLAGG